MGRKLRLLLVDDRPVQELETTHLALVEVPNGPDLDPSLGTWAQHLRLWSDNCFPEEPDLVLIDCRFEEDRRYVPMSGALAERDPRGLLHGALFVARLFGRDRFYPFGFAIYSMDASGFRDDAYAQTFMGFLLAMRDSTLPEGETGFVRGRKDRELVESCASELGRTISQNPATAWGPALRMYRQRLKEVIDLGAYVVDRESWSRALEGVRGGRPDASLSLEWRRFGGERDCVALTSLFADLLESDRWSPGALADARAWLESLLVLGDYLPGALEWALQVVVEQADPETLEIPRGRDLHGQRLTRFFHAAAGLGAWLESRRDPGTRRPSSTLALEIGLSDKQLNRYFHPLCGLPWGRVVERLDEALGTRTWPFPELWELRAVLEAWCARRGQAFPF